METPAAPEATLHSLEFSVLLERLSRKARTPYGRELAIALRPTPSLPEARRWQSATREMSVYRQSVGPLPLSLSIDARPLLLRLEVEGAYLGAQEINTLLEQVRRGHEIRGQLSRCPQPGLRQSGRSMPDLGNLLRYLDGKITPTGELEDRCSTDLLKIRSQLSALTARLAERLRDISARPEVARVLQDTFVALRNNRHVLPVRIEGQSCLEGIVHALSSSGATVYVEPLSTVSLNNELVRLKEQEEVETRRLLLDFSDLLRSRLGELRMLLSQLGEIDLLNARAEFAEELKGVEPTLLEVAREEKGPRLSIRGGRHPILERSLAGSGHRLVPLDLTLQASENVLVISGPNTGGKTVVLKTVGLLALMAQSGLHVPAHEARFPVFRRILIDIGDHQSIPDSLSTFSARLANISTMAASLASPSLVLLDEVGTGTDPEEGASLGAATIEFFRNRDALVLATTHHEMIKAYASTTGGVTNASMEFDEESFRPLYRLHPGIPGRSSGLDIADRLGLPSEIIQHARQLLPRQREVLARYLESLESLRKELEQEREEMARQMEEARQREIKREEAAQRLARDRETRFAQSLEEIEKRILENWTSYLDRIMEQEANRRLRREFARRQRRLLGEARTSLPTDLLPSGKVGRAEPGEPLKPGDPVVIPALRLRGIIERVDGNRAVVRAGAKRVTVPLSELEAVVPVTSEFSLPPGIHLERPSTPEVKLEINLVGQRVEEALAALDKYLDDVYLASVSPVRVVHGLGSGRLRTAVHRFLQTHPHVEGFSDASEREGGRGATLVRVRV